jgi:hypothetical protein
MVDRELKYPKWQIPLEGVITEADVEKLPGRIHSVETLISERLRQLDSTEEAAAEREAINAGLGILRIVKRDQLGFPDWQ